MTSPGGGLVTNGDKGKRGVIASGDITIKKIIFLDPPTLEVGPIDSPTLEMVPR